MKVLATIIIPPHLGVSGAVNAGISLSRALAEHCEVDVALMAFSASEEHIGKARVLQRPSTNLLGFTRSFLPDKFRTLLYTSDIPTLISLGNYDLVHIHNPIPTLEMRRVAAACVRHGVPYVVSTHGFVEVTSGGRAFSIAFHERLAWNVLIERPLRYVVNHATMMFATSPVDIEIVHSLGVPEERIALVTNGVNPFYYAPASSLELEAVRRAFGLPEMKDAALPVCFFLANHTNNKGIDVLIEAFLQSERPYILIVGGKKRPHLPYEEYATRCRPGQRIVFTDSLRDEQVRALFNYADLFVFPSLADTLPLVVLEAMAAGLPILSTTVGGIPYQVDESCGRLVAPGDVLALRMAFEALAADPGGLRSLGAAARLRVQERFDWERSATEAYRHYRAIVSQVRA